MLGKFSQVLHFLGIEAHVAWLQLKILFRIPFFDIQLPALHVKSRRAL